MLIWLFAIVTAIQLLYWWGLFARLAFFRPGEPPAKSTPNPVSVIVCAYNEADNLRQHLPRILAQTYRSLNVVVVNDNSSDKTEYVLSSFQDKHPTLHIVRLTTPTAAGKKDALTAGIRAAPNELLLLTDADCQPATERWADRMVGNFSDEQAEVVLGYGPHERLPGFFNRMVRFETVWTAIQYLSFALAGMPYMGVGRNLAYRKRLFERVGGFTGHADLASGDDDLFINAVADRQNVRIELHPDSFVYSVPKTSLRAWMRQKTRHLSTGTRYRLLHKTLLGSYTVSHLLHYVAALVLLICTDHTALVWTGLLVRWVSLTVLGALICRRLRESDLIPLLPLFDLLLLGYYFLMATVPFRRIRW